MYVLYFLETTPGQSLPMEGAILIPLRRRENSVSWGFRLQGGLEYGSCLYIQKVTPRSIAEKAGLRVGDGILRIGDVPALSLNHEAAKMEIIRSGNDLDLVIKRDAVDVKEVTVNESEETPERRGFSAYTNPDVQSRSFKILQASLNYSDPNTLQ